MDKLTLGQLIRIRRKEKGLTQKQLADFMGLSVSNITKYETDIISPPIEKLLKLEKALELNQGELMASNQIESHVFNLFKGNDIALVDSTEDYINAINSNALNEANKNNPVIQLLLNVNEKECNNKYNLNAMLSDSDFLEDVTKSLTIMARVFMEKY